MSRRQARAFTIIELVVVVGLVLAALALVVGCRGRNREAANRIKCSSNLRQIGLALKMYAMAERSLSYPRTLYDPATAAMPAVFTGPVSPDPFKPGGPKANDVTAGLFLLLRTQEITTDVFLCPDGGGTRMPIPQGKSIQDFSNFTSPTHLGYSMQNPYPTVEAVQSGFKWDDTLPADFAILADLNPGTRDLLTVAFASPAIDQRKANSPNHQGDGQNVLYADGHVDWAASVWAGLAETPGTTPNDNVYTFAKFENGKRTAETAGIVGPPADARDSALLPTR